MSNKCPHCNTFPAPTPDFPAGTHCLLMGGEWYHFCDSCGKDPARSVIDQSTGKIDTLLNIWKVALSNTDVSQPLGCYLVPEKN